MIQMTMREDNSLYRPLLTKFRIRLNVQMIEILNNRPENNLLPNVVPVEQCGRTIVQLYDGSIATTMEPRDGVKYNDIVPCAQCTYNSVRVQCLDQGLEPLDNRARERKQYSASDHTIGKRQLRTDTIRQ